jgi:Domain of Unknown Function (DUF1206)
MALGIYGQLALMDTTVDEKVTSSAQDASPVVKWLARLGMFCAGLLWIVVGILAIQVALGAGGETTDRTGALHEIAGESWGFILLVLIAVGFAGYALWRFLAGAIGRKLETHEELSWPKRLWYFARGVFYAFLCYTTVSILVGAGSGSGSEKQKAEAIFDWPGGRWLVGAIGLGLAGWGLGSVYRALSRNFKDDLHTERMSETAKRWTTRAGVVGYLARGAVFLIAGAFIIKAAVEYDPNEAIGLDGALQKLASQSYGPLLLGIVAAGLVAYGLFYFVRAAHREV